MEKNSFVERNKETTEMWSRIVGRKEKKQRTKENKEDGNKIKNKEPVKEIVRKKRLLKTSAVVITARDENVSYSEMLTWARQSIKLNEEEMSSFSTKRSATGGILLEIKGENNTQLAEKLTEALRTTLNTFKNVRVHRPRQMAKITFLGINVSITREEIKAAVAKEEGCSIDDVTVDSIKNSPRGVGFVWVKCPLAEAKKLDEKKKSE